MPENEDTKETIEDIAKDIVIKEKVPRSPLFTYAVTFGFTLGPLFLIIDLIFPKFFNWFFIDSTMVLGIITIIFFGLSLIVARK